MNRVADDLLYAARGFAKNPGFTLAAVLSLAIGIGATTAIFSVLSALLLHPLPYKDAQRLVILWNRSPGLNIAQDWFSPAQYFDIKNGHGGFEDVAIAIGRNDNLTGDGEPERIGTIHVSSNLLEMLGARPAVGRLFVKEEDLAGAAATALLSYGTWQRRYGGDPQVIGKSIAINGKPYTVVGVTGANFSLPREVLPTLGRAEDAEILLPLPLDSSAAQQRGHEDYNVMGKLKPGVSVQQAQAEMDALTAGLRRDYPKFYPPNGGLTFGIVPLEEQVVGDARRSVLILMGAVSFVLLIACANVTNLLLSRALARQREMAIRSALGAGRAQIVQQLLTESLLLGLLSGALGVTLSVFGVRMIHLLGTNSVPRLQDISVNGEVLGFTLLVSLLSGIVFGLAPALRASRLDLRGALTDASHGSSGAGAVWGRGNSMRRLLVVSELALSVVLLIGAGLLIRSFASLQNVAPGFNPKNVLTLELMMRGRKYNDATSVKQAYLQIWERLEQLPGVSAAGGASSLPMSEMYAWGPINIEGRVPQPGENFINADQRVAGGHFFEAMQIPLRRGRLFNEFDTDKSVRVAIIDEHMADQLWPGGDPLGKRFRFGGIDASDSGDPWFTIVGVVGRVKQYTLDEDSRIALYLPMTQSPSREFNIAVRGAGDPAALAPAVKNAIHQVDAELPLYNVCSMTARVEESLARRRFSMLLLTVFAGFALVLATVGIYGVLAFLVRQGTREIGIRMSLGATQGGILRLIVGRGLNIAVYGVGIGLVGALLLTRFLQSVLFGVRATDPLTFVGIAALLILVAVAASYVPARRAARIDPMVTLRNE
jgi:predicted permease